MPILLAPSVHSLSSDPGPRMFGAGRKSGHVGRSALRPGSPAASVPVTMPATHFPSPPPVLCSYLESARLLPHNMEGTPKAEGNRSGKSEKAQKENRKTASQSTQPEDRLLANMPGMHTAVCTRTGVFGKDVKARSDRTRGAVYPDTAEKLTFGAQASRCAFVFFCHDCRMHAFSA